MQDTNPTPQPAMPQQSTPSEAPVAKKKSNKKIVIILLLVFFVFPLLCCGLFFLLFSTIFGAVNDKKDEVMNAVLLDVCSSHGDISYDQYGEWFDPAVNYDDATSATETIFPQGYDCNELVNKSFLDTVLAGESVSYKNENGRESMEISVNQGFFSLEKSRGVWIISDIDFE
jgi:hypothetical protein